MVLQVGRSDVVNLQHVCAIRNYRVLMKTAWSSASAAASMRLSARPIWNGRGSSVMSDSFIWTLLGHLVCIAQWAAFILVDYAYLGRGRRFRHPCVCAAGAGSADALGAVRFWLFNIKSVVSNIIYLLVIALLFGGTAVDRMSACIINGILCLLTENTVSFVFARLHGICPGEVWHYRTCLAALVISILLVGILVARFLCRWNHCSALDPLQALLMSFSRASWCC